MTLVSANHGILTGHTRPEWTDHLNAHPLFAGCKVLTKEYRAAPLPIWNVFVKNRWLARSLANEIILFDQFQKNFVAHSNGCDITLKAIKSLAARGIKTNAAVFIGGVIEPDAERSGILELINLGFLKSAFAYSSKRDRAIRIHVKWPYKNIGIDGFTLDRKPILDCCFGEGRVVTRRFDDFGHGEYFEPPNRERIFRQIAEDLGILQTT